MATPPKRSKETHYFQAMDIVDAAPEGDTYDEQWKALGAWFLGPRGENKDKFMDLFKVAFDMHVQMREGYYPTDPPYITEEIRSSEAYRKELSLMKEKLIEINKDLFNSVPFFSPRYQAHMCWEVAMPALLGYMSALLYNQNNVDTAASPVTTLYEKSVGLQLCDLLGFDIHKTPKPWGHITCDGSVANIEALWAARNLKFHALGVQDAMNNSDGVLTPEEKNEALKCGVNVPWLSDAKPLKKCTTWELLNLDVDDVCSLKQKIIDAIGLTDKKKLAEFDSLVERHSVTSLGLKQFMERHSIEKDPVYFCPANCHYSWPKAGTLLGLGSNALYQVPLDVNFRQDVKNLETILESMWRDKVPVISVTAVIGSTEESAVDPIVKILAIRERLRKENEGLNFCVLADGAWGGYFKTMIRKTCSEKVSAEAGYMPFCPLSQEVKEQYENIQRADTITIDPHKSGFCPYPSGALCYRNGNMKSLVAIMHPEVYHGEDDPTMGVYGVEGSKPGAAPTGVYMAHTVIGLDVYGYGRILGQCHTTAKLFYSLWLSVARDQDPFTCLPLQQVPANYTLESARALINAKIMGNPMDQIVKDQEAADFLMQVGPDTLINTFVVNIRGNTLVAESNRLQDALSNDLNIMVGMSSKRVPLMVMLSGLSAKNHGIGLIEYKRRIGLDPDTGEDLSVMVNTTMNPWQWNESIEAIGTIFRTSVLNCMGKLHDTPATHQFIVCGMPALGDKFFAEFLPSFEKDYRQYHAIVKFGLAAGNQPLGKGPIYMHTKEPMTLYHLLKETNGAEIPVRFYGPKGVFLRESVVWVEDVPRFAHFETPFYAAYPKKMKYFLFGDENATFMSHCISRSPDFQQIVKLDAPPHSVSPQLIDIGVEICLDDVEGDPLIIDNTVTDPLQTNTYTVSFRGLKNASMKTTIHLTHPGAKILFQELK